MEQDPNFRYKISPLTYIDATEYLLKNPAPIIYQIENIEQSHYQRKLAEMTVCQYEKEGNILEINFSKIFNCYDITYSKNWTIINAW